MTTSKSNSAKRPRGVLTAACVAGAAAVALAISGIADRAKSKQDLIALTDEQAIPTVRLVQPAHGPSEQELVLPGDVAAFNAGVIYARASGYVTDWFQDIGAHVTKGQPLATIDSPELDQQLAQARADLASARANEKLAQVTYERWKSLAARSIVSQQAKDEKDGDAVAKSAAVQAAAANVARLEALTSFKTLTAPFDGIVTARSVDIGDLVSAGGTSGKALFQVSDIHRMRIYVNVPQAFLREMKPGLKAVLDLPGRDETFEATLTSTSNAISESSRTALVELQADNPEGKLWPGAFAEVHFHIPSDPSMLLVPATALIFGPEGMAVAAVDADGKVIEKKVRVGRNLGDRVEIVGGLSLADRLIDSPQESIEAGESVRIAGDEGQAPDRGRLEEASRAVMPPGN